MSGIPEMGCFLWLDEREFWLFQGNGVLHKFIALLRFISSPDVSEGQQWLKQIY